MINAYLIEEGKITSVAVFNSEEEVFDEFTLIDPSLGASVGDYYIDGEVIKDRGEAYGFVEDTYQITDEGLSLLKSGKAEQLKQERKTLELEDINGISVGKQSHRDDIDKYAVLLSQYENASEEDREFYSSMVNSDGSINWTLSDDTVRAVTKEELQQVSLTFLIRKGTLMKQYQEALASLYDVEVTTEEQIENITL